MSFVDDDRIRARIAVLIALVALSALWPAPAQWVLSPFPESTHRIDEESFLGREAVEWDLAFWWIAGITAIAVSGRDRTAIRGGMRRLGEEVRRLPAGLVRLDRRRLVAWISGGLAVTAVTALLLDRPVMEMLLVFDPSPHLEATRLINRLGGGVGPAMTAAFIGLVGVTLDRERWIRLFVAIAGAAVTTAIVLNAAKLLGRARPEILHGPWQIAPGSGSSFPSGHTLSAFLITGAIVWTARTPFRWFLLALAVLIGVVRVATFRHWPSDVVGSAALGLGASWIFVRSVFYEKAD